MKISWQENSLENETLRSTEADFLTCQKSSERFIAVQQIQNGIGIQQNFIAIHPGVSSVFPAGLPEASGFRKIYGDQE